MPSDGIAAGGAPLPVEPGRPLTGRADDDSTSLDLAVVLRAARSRYRERRTGDALILLRDTLQRLDPGAGHAHRVTGTTLSPAGLELVLLLADLEGQTPHDPSDLPAAAGTLAGWLPRAYETVRRYEGALLGVRMRVADAYAAMLDGQARTGDTVQVRWETAQAARAWGQPEQVAAAETALALALHRDRRCAQSHATIRAALEQTAGHPGDQRASEPLVRAGLVLLSGCNRAGAARRLLEEYGEVLGPAGSDERFDAVFETLLAGLPQVLAGHPPVCRLRPRASTRLFTDALDQQISWWMDALVGAHPDLTRAGGDLVRLWAPRGDGARRRGARPFTRTGARS